MKVMGLNVVERFQILLLFSFVFCVMEREEFMAWNAILFGC
jgi:hypothetical protein